MPEHIGQFFFHGKRNSIFHQCSYQTFGLLIGAEKKCCIFNVLSAFHSFLQCTCYCHIFFSGISKFHHLHRISRLIWCEKFFRVAVFVIIDHLHSRVQNISATPVIDIQEHSFRILKILRKIQHDLRPGTTEMIDRLVIIPYYEQIVLWCRQHFYDIILEMIDILKLIYQNITEFLLPGFQDIFSFSKKFIAT